MEPPKKRRKGPIPASQFIPSFAPHDAHVIARNNRAARVLQTRFRAVVKGARVRDPVRVMRRSQRMIDYEERTRDRLNERLYNHRYTAVDWLPIAPTETVDEHGVVFHNPFSHTPIAGWNDDEAMPIRLSYLDSQAFRRGEDMKRLYTMHMENDVFLGNRYVSLVERAVARRNAARAAPVALLEDII